MRKYSLAERVHVHHDTLGRRMRSINAPITTRRWLLPIQRVQINENAVEFRRTSAHDPIKALVHIRCAPIRIIWSYKNNNHVWQSRATPRQSRAQIGREPRD